jgi:hypothetical protein
MTDKEIILEAYADTLRRLYSVYFESTSVAKNQQQRTEAENAFRAGIKFARTIRDRAVAFAEAA